MNLTAIISNIILAFNKILLVISLAKGLMTLFIKDMNHEMILPSLLSLLVLCVLLGP
jgi:hypothetical protein